MHFIAVEVHLFAMESPAVLSATHHRSSQEDVLYYVWWEMDSV